MTTYNNCYTTSPLYNVSLSGVGSVDPVLDLVRIGLLWPSGSTVRLCGSTGRTCKWLLFRLDVTVGICTWYVRSSAD